MMKQAFVVLGLLLAASFAAAQNPPAMYRVGDKGITSPVAIKQVKPRYPKTSLEGKKSAVVTVECVVTTDGQPAKVRVKQPVDPAFDEAAVKAVRQWQFKPGLKDGRPVPVLVEIELTFTAK